jgi:hypothetical protein
VIADCDGVEFAMLTERLATISDSYLAQQRELHKSLDYGVASLGFAPIVKQVMESYSTKSISDYGAGKCNLRKGLHDLGVTDFEYYPYDPVFPEYGPPKAADLVCCIDVLEHIELGFLDTVLSDLRKITRQYGFFSIHVAPAVKYLPDGRNAHLIQEPTSWWLPRICQYFEVGHLQTAPGGFWLLTKQRIA